MKADVINWPCSCSLEETEHDVIWQDGIIRCRNCGEDQPITCEIDEQLVAQVLDAQH